jgi:penicillin-binding protein 2
MKTAYSNRKFIIFSIFAIVGVIYIARLFYIQVIDQSFKLSASNNVFRYITEYPARGLIYDRNGKLLVYNEAVYDLMVVPKLVKSMDTSDLCKLIGIDIQSFKSRLEKARQYSIYIPSFFEKQLTVQTYGYIQEKLYKFPGFYVQARTVRKYPLPIAAHTLGYIGEVNNAIISKNSYYKSGDYIGISGIEKSYEEFLRGRKGVKIKMYDVFNREKGSFQGGKYDTLAVPGKNLYTTLDIDLQTYGEKLMQNKIGSIVAIEPSTGEILALVSSPTYDPNLLVGRIRSENYGKLLNDEYKPLFDRALMAQYPPGSVFKLVNGLVGMQEGVLSQTTAYGCGGAFSLGGGKSVGCHGHFSPTNLIQAIAISCNTYFCQVFRTIMNDKDFKNTRESYVNWRKDVMSFGLGKKFNNDLPNELNGNIPTAEYYDKFFGKGRWYALNIISLAIGQGEIGITPLQLANVAALIANKGYFYTPHIVKAVDKRNFLLSKFSKKNYTVIDSSYFPAVIEGMYQVVEMGTGTIAKMENTSICGKTGTAQNPHGDNHSIFIAFAPKDNPKIAVSVIIENAGYGATYAAPIASLMIEKYLYKKISRPDVEAAMVNADLMSKLKFYKK